MEDYPEELRTPPVSLVSLVGCPELHHAISAFLHSEQPPINTLALPDFSKISVLARKQKDPLASTPPPAGILKRDWLLKHRTKIPAVAAALFSSEQVAGDPAQWLQLCTDLENLKAVLRGRSTKLVVVLVQTSVNDEVSEDLMIALRKRAEIDSKHLIVFVQNDASELRISLNRLASIFAELCNTYYREEGRKIKARIEKKSFTSSELNVRYCFEAAVYAEFRRDWAEALRFYEDGYRALREMIGTSTRLPPIQRLVEIKAVAEQLHFKISTLLLHGGKVVEAITWFNKHIAGYERLVGAPEIAFLHWEWFSRQFLVFAELLETSSAAIPSTLSPRFGTSENPLTDWEFQPAYYYQLAANYLREKRYCLECCASMPEYSELSTKVGDVPESVMPSAYVGQYARLFEQGDTITVLLLSDSEYVSYAHMEAQRFQDTYEIIALFRKAYESFSGLKAPRIASYCGNRMAREYFIAKEFGNAKQLFDGVACLYRQEGWVTLLWESLGYLRECSQRLGSAKDFVEYSLEMAALPIFSDIGVENSENKRVYGPAGPATLSMRQTVQEEVFNLLKGEHVPVTTDGSCILHVTEDEPICLDIDLVSPLRVAFLASVAFHDQSVKPGSPTMITVSLLSQLPCPIEVDQLEIQFNQSTCNFIIVNAQKYPSTEKFTEDDQRSLVETAPSLTLSTNKWLRLTYEVKSGQSGKLECLSVSAKIGHSFMISCRAESPASMEDLPLWKFEEWVESFPTKDPGLAFYGQKVIQVEEPEPQVDLILGTSGPALVGEDFIVPVTVESKGHAVHSGELKINLVDARGGGMLMSPRDAESFSSDRKHVELLGISGIPEEDESQTDLDNVRKIQHSFGVVSIPILGVGESWSSKLEIKWHRPKSVMLYVSLGYCTNSTEAASQRFNVHRSLQIEGKIPIIISHRFMMPFRQEPLLLSKVRALPGYEHRVSLAVNAISILIVSARNCSEVPLRLLSMSIEMDDDDDSQNSCSVQHIGGFTDNAVLLVSGEEFKGVFSVTPHVDTLNLDVGTVCINWTRDSKLGSEQQDSIVVTKQRLPDVKSEKPPIVVNLECPAHAILGVPFSFYVRVRNLTSLLQEIKYSLGDSQSFVFCGPHNDAAFILPKAEHLISYKLVALGSGPQQLPRITVTSVRYSAALNTTAAAATVFVYPSEPKFNMEESKQETVSSQ
ncbi:trafficking protein particle complex subunit 11 [Phoenix dactylifera]|uniref:Trafficking protein particle complex subunit 11 n=1 Tax=Phoenix dactylifera TaxID=42345 RepID=A0A8B7BWW8_PHODC|nr:trafficking protein particle complex subunit 11 [Phoenix dactylifera]